MSRRLGLIIGANQYQDPTFRPLQYAENDARAIAQWLVNSKGGQWKPSDVQHLQGSHVTKQLIESLIIQMCLKLAEPGDLALVYFAGHVFLDETSGEGYLALTDTRYRMAAATGLSLASLAQRVLQHSRASHILIILDTFQTGRAWATASRSTPFDSKPLLGPALFNLIQQQPNRQFLCSCRGNDTSPEAGGQGLGRFMHRMVINLSGPARDADGNISLRQLHGQLFSSLGEQQRPQLFGRDQPPLILVGESIPTTGALQHAPAGPGGTARTNSGQLPSTENFRISTATLQAQKADTGKQQAMVDQHRQMQCQRMLEQAQELLQGEQIQQAYSLIEQVLQISPYFPPALTLKAQVLGSTGNHQEALGTIEQLIQVEPNNSIAWSMKAVVLSNVGQYQAALVAIERSLELDVSNLETHGIKNNIMANLATEQTRERVSSNLLPPLDEPQGGARTFFIALGLQVLGFIIGVVGAVQPILLTSLPGAVGIGLMSLGLLILTANAAGSAHRYGLSHLVPTCLMSVIAVVALVGTYLVGYQKIVNFLADPRHPEQGLLLGPIIFLGIWLITAAAMPFIAALGGLISGSIARARRRRKANLD